MKIVYKVFRDFWPFAVTTIAVMIWFSLIIKIDEDPPIMTPTVYEYPVEEYEVTFPRQMHTVQKKSVNIVRKDQSSVAENVLILAWSRPWLDKGRGYKEGERIGKCTITYNRLKLNEAKAVLFHCFISLEKQLPWRLHRSNEQVFIWWCEEAPPILKALRNPIYLFEDFFNWTFTYRYDADVVDSYGDINRTLSVVKKGKAAVDVLIAKKERLAVWLVSQCTHRTREKIRMMYAMSLLRAGIQFDGYGSCFRTQLKLPRSKVHKTAKLIAKYKFYFAFENSMHCTDYITEKFWVNALQYGAVPIVLGPSKEDVLKVAPLDSFIHVEDFKSPRQLAEYLIFLDKNITEYRKYFRWREDETMTEEKMMKLIEEKYPQIQVHRRKPDLCEKILTLNNTKTIPSLIDEFINKNPRICNHVTRHPSLLKQMISSE